MHQDLPFERLVEELQPERDLSRNPLVQVFFALQNAPAQPLELSGLRFAVEERATGYTPFDIFMEFIEGSECLKGRLHYSLNLFERETIGRMAGHYQHLLEVIVADPQQSVWTLSLLTEAERHQLLVEWNATQTPYPHQCIHHLFEEQARQHPDAVALNYQSQQLTYRELNERANQVAHALQHLRVGVETLVAVCMERSLELVVAILGVLKAGAAYVPLDPQYPAERIAFILQDTRVSAIIAHEKLLGRIPVTTTGVPQVLLLDSQLNTVQSEQTSPVSSPVTDRNLAYVMYTSGSTGKPKGVAVEHRSVVRLVRDTNYARLSSSDTFLLFSPIAFDASTFELWSPLLNGGRLIVYPSQFAGLEELGMFLVHHGVTTLWLTAGLFHEMVESSIDNLRGVHQLLAGGDVLSLNLTKRVLKELPHCRLINGYGPTENTTFSTCFPMTESTQFGTSVPIGRPIANTQVYVLDPHLQPVPVGVPGELYLGGDGLARGYLNLPELTRERFVSHPFLPDSDARLYKTGDLVRYLPDGNLEFLGRRDNQVKIRGFRIELGEIEVVLAQHPAVGTCVVVVQEDASHSKQLIAYIVSHHQENSFTHQDQPQLRPQALKDYLKTYLPDYMIPLLFVFLDALPLNANHKVNRAALPPPDWNEAKHDHEAAPSHTSLEEMLVQIWQQVLGIEHVGINDNFFDLGGHSLTATRVASQARKQLRIELPLHIIFERPTIIQLAQWLEQTHADTLSDPQHFPLDAQRVEELLQHIDDLSEEEVENLLARMSTGKDMFE